MKPESLDNQLVRAFGRATGALYCVKSGKEAIDMLRKSAAVRRVRGEGGEGRGDRVGVERVVRGEGRGGRRTEGEGRVA